MKSITKRQQTGRKLPSSIALRIAEKAQTEKYKHHLSRYTDISQRYVQAFMSDQPNAEEEARLERETEQARETMTKYRVLVEQLRDAQEQGKPWKEEYSQY